MSTNRLLDRSFWPNFTAFVKVLPDGDILPAPCKYSQASNDWQIGVNQLRLDATEPNAGLWFSLPDVVASVVLTGKVPRIVDASALEPQGVSHGLTPTALNGQLPVDPAKEDFFKTVSRADFSAEEKARLDRSLKVLANPTSYGIYEQASERLGISHKVIRSEPTSGCDPASSRTSACGDTYRYAPFIVLARERMLPVEIREIHRLRHRHPVVAPKVSGFSFNAAFFVMLGRRAKLRLEAPVRAERRKASRLFPPMTAQDLLHCGREVVVAQLAEHTTEVGKRQFVRFQKRLLRRVQIIREVPPDGRTS